MRGVEGMPRNKTKSYFDQLKTLNQITRHRKTSQKLVARDVVVTNILRPL